MKNCNISSERHICIHIGGVSFNQLLVSLLDNIFLQYNTRIVLACSSETSIGIQFNITTQVVSIPHDIFVSG